MSKAIHLSILASLFTFACTENADVSERAILDGPSTKKCDTGEEGCEEDEGGDPGEDSGDPLPGCEGDYAASVVNTELSFDSTLPGYIVAVNEDAGTDILGCVEMDDINAEAWLEHMDDNNDGVTGESSFFDVVSVTTGTSNKWVIYADQGEAFTFHYAPEN